MPLDISAFIDGTPRDAAPELEQRNPANPDEVVSRLPESGAGLVTEAAEAARAALPDNADGSESQNRSTRSGCLHTGK